MYIDKYKRAPTIARYCFYLKNPPPPPYKDGRDYQVFYFVPSWGWKVDSRGPYETLSRGFECNWFDGKKYFHQENKPLECLGRKWSYLATSSIGSSVEQAHGMTVSAQCAYKGKVINICCNDHKAGSIIQGEMTM